MVVPKRTRLDTIIPRINVAVVTGSSVNDQQTPGTGGSRDLTLEMREPVQSVPVLGGSTAAGRFPGYNVALQRTPGRRGRPGSRVVSR